MKLNYNAKRIITTADLFDACNPPLVFEVKSRPGKEWSVLDDKFDDTNHTNIEIARELISLAFLTVSDDENTYPISKVSQVKELQSSIEQLIPGNGEFFILNIARAFSVNQYNMLVANLGNSLKPLLQSNGNGPKIEKVKVS